MQHVKEHETITLIEIICQAMEYFFKDFYAFLIGCIVSFIGYLLPVKNIVNLLILFFILDVVFGFWAANVLRNERFSVKIIWKHTIPRMLISVILITGAFMWDEVYHQEFVSTYKIIGWFISGVIISAIIIPIKKNNIAFDWFCGYQIIFLEISNSSLTTGISFRKSYFR